MRKSVSPLPGNECGGSASTTRVFGVPLAEVTRAHTVSGHEVPALVKHIVEYIEEHGERQNIKSCDDFDVFDCVFSISSVST